MMQPYALNHNAPSGDQSPLRIDRAGLEALKPIWRKMTGLAAEEPASVI